MDVVVFEVPDFIEDGIEMIAERGVYVSIFERREAHEGWCLRRPNLTNDNSLYHRLLGRVSQPGCHVWNRALGGELLLPAAGNQLGENMLTLFREGVLWTASVLLQ